MQRPGGGRLFWQGGRAWRISADRIGDKGSRSDQADGPATHQERPNPLPGTGQAHQADSKHQREQAGGDEVAVCVQPNGPSASELTGWRSGS